MCVSPSRDQPCRRVYDPTAHVAQPLVPSQYQPRMVCRVMKQRWRIRLVALAVVAAHAIVLWRLQGMGQTTAVAPSPPAQAVAWVVAVSAGTASVPPASAAAMAHASPGRSPPDQRHASRPAPARGKSSPTAAAVASAPTATAAPAPAALPGAVASAGATTASGVRDEAPASPAGSAHTAGRSNAGSNTGSPTPAAAGAARVELPSSSADYLDNPRPAYPALSRRLGEQGQVVVRVRVEADGSASRAEIQKSSGYERLDRAALQAVLHWRFVPGRRAGVPEAMWSDVPLSFVLE